MKIIKYQKINSNTYKITTDKEDYKLYDDTIIKYNLLLKKEITLEEMEKIIVDNNHLKAYYDSLKLISIKMRNEYELINLLKKKKYTEENINYAIKRCKEENYLNREKYIIAYIHDALALSLIGENKIRKDLKVLGFKDNEIEPFLAKVDKKIYQDKIKKYIDKKAKINKKSIIEFKRKIAIDLVGKGCLKEDILSYLDNIKIFIQ